MKIRIVALVLSAALHAPAFAAEPVPYDGVEDPGTIVVDTRARNLLLVTAPGEALSYDVAVGRPSEQWTGVVYVGRKSEWPSWSPTATMRKRDPKLPATMPGGPGNPLGARALYLFADGGDTSYRIHGTNTPKSIGREASSGCIRMRNEDVEDLYERVEKGALVVIQ
ncbi:L,D-transpeptidase [Methylobacterium fujisawaense]|jgi:lipoprotein-anchoring transpeptidase ErfK/SrfK